MVASIALILLVDRDGRILVQLHDEQATTRPNRWSLPGGLVAAGQTPAAAALRFAGEQAGVPVEGDVEQFWSGFVPGHRVLTFAFFGRTPATPADVAAPVNISEAGRLPLPTGVTKLFLPGDQVLKGRSFTLASGYVLARFLESVQYGRINPVIAPTAMPRLE